MDYRDNLRRAAQGGSILHADSGVNIECRLTGSTEDGWTPNRPGAFDEPLVTIPWVQILELLGRVPENATGEFLDGGGKLR